ncbi:MAG: AmmeMemoRadiSam system protein B [Candidatus Binatia bacterium]
MSDRPQLRRVDAFPLQQDGKNLICLQDPLHFSKPLGVSPETYFVLCQLDGRHSLVDIQAAYSKRFNAILLSEDLIGVIDLLDRHYYLKNQRFLDYQGRINEEFCRMSERPPAHVASVYKEDPEDLRAQLSGYFHPPDGPGDPTPKHSNSVPKAIVAPHIDFHRGGPCYAWAYKGLAECPGADLYILLGTSHNGGENPFTATLKDFVTPLGTVETDKEFIRKLQKSYDHDLFADEHLHRTEHSLEFQVVYLKYLAEFQAALSAQKKPFKIVPILVSSFHGMVINRTLPERDPRIANFLETLRGLVQDEARRVCFVAGVDLAHVGAQFGDRDPITPEFMKWVEQEDQSLIKMLAGLDARGFFDEIAKDQDRRRICGFSPLYSLIHLLDGTEGRCLKYSQAFTAETGSTVTFTSMVFD